MITPEEFAERQKLLGSNITKSLAFLMSLPGSEQVAAEELSNALENAIENPFDPTNHTQVLLYSTILLAHLAANEKRQQN